MKKKYKKNPIYIYGCKIGCAIYKTLITSIICGEWGKTTLSLNLFIYRHFLKSGFSYSPNDSLWKCRFLIHFIIPNLLNNIQHLSIQNQNTYSFFLMENYIERLILIFGLFISKVTLIILPSSSTFDGKRKSWISSWS